MARRKKPPAAKPRPKAQPAITPSLADFRALWKAGATPPVWRELLADFETPLSIFAKLDRGSNAFLLESVEGGEVWGRYSILCGDVSRYLVCGDTLGKMFATLMTTREQQSIEAGDPLSALRTVLAARRARQGPGAEAKADAERLAPPSPFRGGAVGHLTWEAIHRYAPVPRTKPPKVGTPEACFLLPEEWVVFDRLRSRIAIVADTGLAREKNAADATAVWRDAVRRIEAIEKRLAGPVAAPRSHPARFRRSPFSLTDAEYMRAVEKAQEYIRAGDVIQVVLSRRREGAFDGNPLDVYRALRLVNPSPYMFFLRLHFGVRSIAGSSPEALVRVKDGVMTTRPIAGTRPRGRTPDEDARLGLELLADEKERAEHLMLVDLGRNDLGRVAQVGSVQVPEFMRVERYSHVMHIVSDVTAKLRPDRDAFDAVASVFPAGTLSGAPKIRAMQIVAELEGKPRDVYGGLVGWFGTDGNADTCIAIRTVDFPGSQQRYRVQAGAGIVFDSVPKKEADETAAKAEGVMRALALAAEGL